MRKFGEKCSVDDDSRGIFLWWHLAISDDGDKALIE